MLAFLRALGHLLLLSLHSTFGWMGTTLLAVAAGFIAQFVAPWVDQRLDGVKPEGKSTLKRIRGSVIIAVSMWIVIYSINVVYTIYDSHRGMVKENQRLAAALKTSDDELSRLRTSLEGDEEKIKALTVPEARDSLRLRTIRVVDEWHAYARKRAEVQPPFAAPNSSDPNPSEETKKAIQTWRKFSQETEDYYAKHFRDRMLGIIKEYQSKGVPTGFLENTLRQSSPGLMPKGSGYEDSPMDPLNQFRDLAYRVDARDHLVAF